ncbi:hypothetical protein QYM36_003134 [Artemia franciscana]|nr:hypothetical protein QYM36_003134 [Artemia franciscana]
MQQNGDVDGVRQIVCSSINAVSDEFGTNSLPANLLSDAIDLLRVDQAEELFGYVEDRIDLWKSEAYFDTTKNIILRMCNDLLRRLSKSEKNLFCGRILLFLARFFPLSEKSGLNIVGEFNLDNITTFADSDDDEVLGSADDAPKEEKFVNGNVYKTFWSLQDFFRNPNKCYTSVGWETFSKGASEIFSVLSGFKLEQSRGKKRKNESDAMDTSEISMDFVHSGKYLTKKELFDLELNDPKFRKNILLQFLILFQYLQVPTKFKTSAHVLKEDQLAFVKDSVEKVYKLVEETSTDGKQFLLTVKHILKREELWNQWKNEGCKKFEKPNQKKPKDGVPPPKKAKVSSVDKLRQAVREGKTDIGSDHLNSIWNATLDEPSNMEDSLPQVENFFSEAIKELDLPVTNPKKQINNENFIWRGLRLLRLRCPQIFQSNLKPTTSLPEYMEVFVEKLSKEGQKEIQTAASTIKQENVEEVEDGGDEMKEEGMKDEGSNAEETLPAAVTMCTSEDMKLLAPRIATEWRKIASRLNFKPDEMEYLETKYSDVEQQAYEMLLLWIEKQEEDATAEILMYEIGGSGVDVKFDGIFPPTSS